MARMIAEERVDGPCESCKSRMAKIKELVGGPRGWESIVKEGVRHVSGEREGEGEVKPSHSKQIAKKRKNAAKNPVLPFSTAQADVSTEELARQMQGLSISGSRKPVEVTSGTVEVPVAVSQAESSAITATASRSHPVTSITSSAQEARRQGEVEVEGGAEPEPRLSTDSWVRVENPSLSPITSHGSDASWVDVGGLEGEEREMRNGPTKKDKCSMQ